jgi:uncharacterized protein (UPF0335 family)
MAAISSSDFLRRITRVAEEREEIARGVRDIARGKGSNKVGD